MKILMFSLVTVAVSLSAASAQYVSNFDSLTGNLTLSGQDGWDTDDTNQSDYVGVVPGYSDTLTDYWAIHGGLVASPEPSSSNTLLWRSFTAIPNTATTEFSVRMSISSSVSPRTTQDTFGWILSDSSNDEVVEVRFSPSGSNLQIGWVDYTTGSTYTDSGWAIPYNSEYLLSATIADLDTGSPSFLVSITDAFNVTTVVVSSTLSAGATDIGRVSSSWSLPGSPSGFGNNSMIFQDLSVVPEPGAAALVALGMLGLAAFRMRTRKL